MLPVLALLLAATITIDGGDREAGTAQPILDPVVMQKVWATVTPPAPDPCRVKEELVHGLIVDTARVAGGAFVDLWSTEYALARCGGCGEGNPLGLSPSARRLLKGGAVVGSVYGLHVLRKTGHPVWAKWVGRGLLAAQLGAATNNVIRAHRN